MAIGTSVRKLSCKRTSEHTNRYSIVYSFPLSTQKLTDFEKSDHKFSFCTFDNV